MSKINPIVQSTRSVKIHIDLFTSNIADKKAMLVAASHLNNTCYARYGSMLDFYIPANKVDYWVNSAEAHGLNVVG